MPTNCVSDPFGGTICHERPSREGVSPAPGRKEGGDTFEVPEAIKSAAKFGSRKVQHKMLKEVGLGELSELLEKGRGKLQLPLGVTFALKLQEKQMSANARAIAGDPVRRACAEVVSKTGQQTVWVESGGMVEIGSGAKGTLELGYAVGVAARARGIVQYRRLTPYAEPSGRVSQKRLAADALEVPVKASMALAMGIGAEFELRGEGELDASARFGVVRGLPAHELLEAKLEGRFKAGVRHDQQFMIRTQRLPGNLVMVTHEKHRDDDLRFSAQIKAAVKLDVDKLAEMPEGGQGALAFMAEHSDLLDVPKLLSQYAQAAAKIRANRKKSSSETESFVLDLSHPDAQSAYEKIFSSLSVASLREMSEDGHVAIRRGNVHGEGLTSSMEMSARAAQQSLLTFEVATTHKCGTFKSRGKEIATEDSKFHQNFNTWFSGSKNIDYEGVNVDDKLTGETSHYYHLSFSGKDKVTEAHEISDFFSFVGCLGFRPAEKVDLPRISKIAKLLSFRDDTETKVDLFFTDAGVKQIDAASFDEALASHLIVSDQFQLGKGNFPFIIKDATSGLEKVNREHEGYQKLQAYKALSSSWFWTRWWHQAEMTQLKVDYEVLCEGRDVERDAVMLANSEVHAERMDALDGSSDPQSVNDFFTNLGWIVGFDYMKTLAAMARIAGPEETLVNELAMRGGGMNYIAVTEGIIQHPSTRYATNLIEEMAGVPLGAMA